jgi:hypothetical protein
MAGPEQVAQAEPQVTPAEKLVEGLRALIAEQIGLAGAVTAPEKSAAQSPNWSDTPWLLIVIANLVTLATLAPDELIKKDRWEFFLKLIPWLFGGFFLTHAAWIRDHFVNLSRQTGFRISQVVLLAAASALQFQIFSITPVVLPPKAVLLIDNAPKRRVLHLNFGNHEVQIVPPETAAGSDAPKLQPRKFTLTRWQLLSLSMRRRSPEWSLLIPVDLSLDNKGYTVEIRRAASSEGKHFPADFLDTTDLDVVDSYLLSDKVQPGMDIDEIMLPIGAYLFTAQRGACRSQVTKVVNLDDDQVPFPPLVCGHP